VAKKPTKPASSKSTPSKPAVKAKAPAAKAAAPAAEAPVAADSVEQPAKTKAPIPPRPVPPHQQFLSKTSHKPQKMGKGRIFRHQGR